MVIANGVVLLKRWCNKYGSEGRQLICGNEKESNKMLSVLFDGIILGATYTLASIGLSL